MVDYGVFFGCSGCGQILKRLYFTDSWGKELKDKNDLGVCVDCKAYNRKQEDKSRLSVCCGFKLFWDFEEACLKCSSCRKEVKE